MARQQASNADNSGTGRAPGRSRKVLNNGQFPSPSKLRTTVVDAPILNDDNSEKISRSSLKRNVLDEINRNIIAAASPVHRPQPDSDLADSSPRVPLLSNFEEWMKLATDNVRIFLLVLLSTNQINV